jgi:hypothetical protein
MMLCRLTDLDTGQRVCSNSSGMVWQRFHPRDSDGSSLKMSVNVVKNPNKFMLLKATITWSSHVKQPKIARALHLQAPQKAGRTDSKTGTATKRGRRQTFRF